MRARSLPRMFRGAKKEDLEVLDFLAGLDLIFVMLVLLELVFWSEVFGLFELSGFSEFLES